MGNHKYFVLLITTDGEITDMNDTMEMIIEAANTVPLSIIIVGVGQADFTKMNKLDGDDKQLEYDGRVAKRDIVQFVAMRDFDQTQIQYQLPAALLAEVPKQLEDYMVMNDFKPMNFK